MANYSVTCTVIPIGYSGPSSASMGPITVSSSEGWQGSMTTTADPVNITISGAIRAIYRQSKGGSVGTATQIASSTPSANGYTFNGWKYVVYRGYTILRSGTTTNLSTILLTVSELQSGAYNMELQGQWTAAGGTGGNPGTGGGGGGVTLTFNGNGGSGVPSPIYLSQAGSVTIPSTRPTRAGYEFSVWNTSPDGSGKSVGPNNLWPVIADQTLYAQWRYVGGTGGDPGGGTTTPPVTPTYTASFRDSWSGQSTSITSAQGYITLPTVSWTRTGYRMAGWMETSTGMTYQFGARFYLQQNTFFNIIWEQEIINYTVTFNANGGTCYTTTRTVQQGQALGSLPTATRTGYTFRGWYTSPSGGSRITESSPFYGNTTLYAQWDVVPLNDPRINCVPSVQAKRGSTINVTWSLYGQNIVFTLERSVNGGSWTTVYSSTSSTSYTYTTPSNFNSVQFRVRARSTSTGATSNYAVSNTITVDKGSAPSRPSSCTVRSNENDSTTIFTNSTKTTYNISWTNSTDPDNDMRGYEIQFCTSNNQTWRGSRTFGVSTLNTTARCSELTGATWVKYRVRAYDQFNQYSAWRESSQVTVSALSAPKWSGSGWIRYPVPTADTVREQEPFKIQWSNATDVDGDLYRYVLEREDNQSGNWTSNQFSLLVRNVQNNQPEWTDVIKSATINKIRYRVKAQDQTQRETTYITGPVITVVHNTPPKAPKWLRARVEQTAIDEGHRYQMQPLKGGEYNEVLWDFAQDAENNVTGYQLECSLDGERFQIIKGYNEGAAALDRKFQYFIPKSKTVRHDTAQFRVKAKDAYGEESPYVMSRSYNISNNSTPSVQGEHSNKEYIGVYEHAFPIIFLVTDEENDTVNVEVSIYDGNAKIKELWTGRVETPYEGTVILTDRDLSELPMRRLTVRVTARDREGEGRYEFDFTRKGTRAFVTLRTPVRYPDPITGCVFTALEGLFPPDCRMLIEVTNNANDPQGGFWEECTAEARAGRLYEFQNKIATYGPAFNFRLTCERGPSGVSGYISRITGYFETATEKEAPRS